MRTFLGIDFDEQLKQNIFEFQQKIKKYASKGRWKYIDNFHLTIRFLDEINEHSKINIDKVLSQLCLKHNTFSLKLKNTGTFASKDDKDGFRVLWVGVSGQLNKLINLKKDVDIALNRVGFPFENRPYSPHITIGQDIIFDCPLEKINKYVGELNTKPFYVNKIHLFESKQIGKNRVYNIISTYHLKGE